MKPIPISRRPRRPRRGCTIATHKSTMVRAQGGPARRAGKKTPARKERAGVRKEVKGGVSARAGGSASVLCPSYISGRVALWHQRHCRPSSRALQERCRTLFRLHSDMVQHQGPNHTSMAPNRTLDQKLLPSRAKLLPIIQTNCLGSWISCIMVGRGHHRRPHTPLCVSPRLV